MAIKQFLIVNDNKDNRTYIEFAKKNSTTSDKAIALSRIVRITKFARVKLRRVWLYFPIYDFSRLTIYKIFKLNLFAVNTIYNKL